MCRMVCLLKGLENEAFLLSQGARTVPVTAVIPAPTISGTPEEKILLHEKQVSCYLQDSRVFESIPRRNVRKFCKIFPRTLREESKNPSPRVQVRGCCVWVHPCKHSERCPTPAPQRERRVVGGSSRRGMAFSVRPVRFHSPLINSIQLNPSPCAPRSNPWLFEHLSPQCQPSLLLVGQKQLVLCLLSHFPVPSPFRCFCCCFCLFSV